ncbi:SDR family oxidoreductase [Rothia uropygialis]|uniref:SDR family oxidoreductase n=1 Tax=Kocuria sp. 36 TaxID=1415402 RepID=UPI00101D7EF6|nr:SDR family oxidoreductase [Kocuria sp. 36]
MGVETRSLQDTVVAITGASSGIGRETARLLVQRGAKVSIGARRADRLEALQDELGADNVLPLQLDVTDPASANAFINATVDRFGKIDSLIANAGIGYYGGITDNTDEQLDNMVQVNVNGTVWAIRAAVPRFRDAGAGDIVIVASVAGLRGGADEAVYAGTKFAQVGLAGAIDRELRPEGIRVTAICPAGTKTEFALGAGRTEGDPSLDAYLAPEDIAFQIATVLEQPRRLRTTLWASWSMSQSS